MGIVESESKNVSGGIISGILDWLADFFDRVSPQHQAAHQEAAQAKADLDNAYAKLQDQYTLLLSQYNTLSAQRVAALNEQVVAEKQADIDAEAIKKVQDDAQKTIDTIKSKSDDVLLHDRF